MKKILLIVLAVVVAAGLVALFIYQAAVRLHQGSHRQDRRQDLATVVSGTGQIKPKTYVNLGATAMGRVTHLYVKEGDMVKKGQTVATIENVQQEANVAGQQAAIAAAKTDIASYIAAEKTAEANVEHAKADLEQKQLDWERAQAPLQGRHHGQTGFRRQESRLRHRRRLRGPGRGAAQPGQGADRLRARPSADPGGHAALQPGSARPDHRRRAL